jgi:hypothetical protein
VAGAPFLPVVPFPAPASKARHARPPTDPIERLSTQSFQSTDAHERLEDSTLALLRGVGDATGRVDAPPEFESSTSENRGFGGRAGTEPDEHAETSSVEKVNPTEQDLPLVKPPPGSAHEADEADETIDADAGAEQAAAAAPPARTAPSAAPAASTEPASDDAEPRPRPDRLARGLRAFGIKPTARDEVGMFRVTGSTRVPEAPERPETSPLIPPPAPPPAPAASAVPAPAPAAPVAASAPSAEPPPTGTSVKVPISTAPSSLPPPSEKQSAISGPSPACPQCEAPMAWVEAHLRFYCKSCKMYF